MVNIDLSLPDGFLNEEIRCDHLVSQQMKEVWAIELDMAQKLLDFCQQHNLRIWACGGTILGAARHKGMIPWDDDIDFMMPREDFEKLCAHKDEFTAPYYLETPIEPNSRYKFHAKVRNCNTTAILTSEMRHHWFRNNLGIFVDIFPLDSIPTDVKKANKHRRVIKRKILWASRCFKFTADYKNHKTYGSVPTFFKHVLCSILNFFSNYKERYRKVEKEVQRYNNSTDIWGYGLISSPYLGPRFSWEKSYFDAETIYMDFEFLKFPVLASWESFLEKTYGDWHQIVKGGAVHTVAYFDTERPFAEVVQDIGPIEQEVREKGIIF